MLLGGHVVRWACEDDKSALADMDVKQCCGKVWTQEMLGVSLELNVELYRNVRHSSYIQSYIRMFGAILELCCSSARHQGLRFHHLSASSAYPSRQKSACVTLQQRFCGQ